MTTVTDLLQLCNLKAINSSASNRTKFYIFTFTIFLANIIQWSYSWLQLLHANSKLNCCISEYLHSWLCK